MSQGQKRSLFTLYLAYFAHYFSWGAAIAFLTVPERGLSFFAVPT